MVLHTTFSLHESFLIFELLRRLVVMFFSRSDTLDTEFIIKLTSSLKEFLFIATCDLLHSLNSSSIMHILKGPLKGMFKLFILD